MQIHKMQSFEGDQNRKAMSNMEVPKRGRNFTNNNRQYENLKRQLFNDHQSNDEDNNSSGVRTYKNKKEMR